MIKLYNTLVHDKQEFKPIKNKTVGLYACGPTVYDFAHLGNLRTYIFEDILKRVLQYNGYKVKHVMNVTDVGHLVSDADDGEDKMMKALKREGLEPNLKSLKKLADQYFKVFQSDMKKLKISEPDKWCKATEHIKEQVDLVKILMEKGIAYDTEDAVYFDTSKVENYGKLTRQSREELEPGARVAVNRVKKNPTDFALWKKNIGKHKNHIMHWPSPWGEGFPGWHIECSAMSRKHLGQPFDIHCGGIDHVPVHHTNEIAQSEAAYDTPLANYWIHGEFLTVGEGKMAKSAGTFITVADVEKKEIDPLAYRYLNLTANYRSKLNFTWDSLKAAENALHTLQQEVRYWQKPKKVDKKALEKFSQAINDDLDMPKALAQLWMKAKERSSDTKSATIIEMDKVFGLGLKKLVGHPPKISAKVNKLMDERETARKEKDWEKADEIRSKIDKEGYIVEDKPTGPIAKLKI